jgi:formylglycine-generating enzyme required for sulfatase activity
LVGNERRCLKPKDSFKDCPDCPEMVVVPAGSFTMGSPEDEPGHQESGVEDQVTVTFARRFGVGRFAVTRGEFAAFVSATGHKTDDGCIAWSGSNWEQMADRSWRSPGLLADRSPPGRVHQLE